jgi:hypothetical protein
MTYTSFVSSMLLSCREQLVIPRFLTFDSDSLPAPRASTARRPLSQHTWVGRVERFNGHVLEPREEYYHAGLAGRRTCPRRQK